MSRSLELYSYLSKFTLFNIYFFYNFLQSSEGNALLHYMGVATEQLSCPTSTCPGSVQTFIQFRLSVRNKSFVVQSSEGNALLHYMGVATEQLSPPHNYVPWIVVDGVHNEQIGKHIIAVR